MSSRAKAQLGPYTFVELTVRGVPAQTFYFLVPVERDEAVAEAKRRIGERGVLTTIDGQLVRASTLDPDAIIERGSIEHGGDSAGEGALIAIDGSVARAPVSFSMSETECCPGGPKLRASWEVPASIHATGMSGTIGNLGFRSPHCGAFHPTPGRVFRVEEKTADGWKMLTGWRS